MIILRDRYTHTPSAGHRWHIDCFRCNICNVIVDSDADLHLLDDESLVCDDCAYNCGVCNNKIEGLAILTGDEAFCATCFKCRKCKKKIENLQCSRTSKGMYCRECFKSLVGKRQRQATKNEQPEPGTPTLRETISMATTLASASNGSITPTKSPLTFF